MKRLTYDDRGYMETNWLESIRYPGLSPRSRELPTTLEDISKQRAVLERKTSRDWAWVVLLGGTGTGKSTLYNLLCGREISQTGLIRPQTRGPVVFAHRSVSLQEHLPAFLGPVEHVSWKAGFQPQPGMESRLLIVEHTVDECHHLVLVDTPDVDSLVLENQKMAEDLFLLSDLVLFVTSQEKYADQAGFAYVHRILKEDRSFFFILNKAEQTDPADKEALLHDLWGQLALEPESIERLKRWTWFLPLAERQEGTRLAKTVAFQDLQNALTTRLQPAGIKDFLAWERSRACKRVQQELGDLIDILDVELQLTGKWREQLEDCFQKAVQSLLEREEIRFKNQGRAYIQAEVNTLYARFDFLAKPRRAVIGTLLMPARLLGLIKSGSKKERKKALWEARQKWDSLPLIQAVAGFNRDVLEHLTPGEKSAPLHKQLQKNDLIMDRAEITELVQKEQDKLAEWLEGEFETLAREASKGKRIGIYSTTALWGALLISFETVIGGGLSLMEGVADAILGPFLSKGAVGLFASRDIRRISDEMALRYRQSLISILTIQKERYLQALESVSLSREDIGKMQEIQAGIQPTGPAPEAGVQYG